MESPSCFHTNLVSQLEEKKRFPVCVNTTSLVSQTHFRKRGKGLVNCVYTGMQLAGWRNQVSNAVLNYLLQGKYAPWKLFSKCFYSSCSSGKDVLALLRRFQDCYCCWNDDVMYHVTKYCNVIGAHCTVRRDKACICSSPHPSLVVYRLKTAHRWGTLPNCF